MLLFGLPLFVLYTPTHGRLLATTPKILRLLALLGLALSALSIAIMTASMAGVGGLAELMLADVQATIMDTSMGRAWLARVMALMLLAAVIAVRPRTGWSVVLAGVALGSLAWTGHARREREPPATFCSPATSSTYSPRPLGSERWLLSNTVFGSTDVLVARQALDRFATAGTVIVATIVATGLSSSALLIGWSGLAELPATRYGQRLLLKLVLFVGMLALAAMNRFRLTPALVGGGSVTRSTLRRSLAVETGAAVSILALVAWLGTLEPAGAAS